MEKHPIAQRQQTDAQNPATRVPSNVRAVSSAPSRNRALGYNRSSLVLSCVAVSSKFRTGKRLRLTVPFGL